MTRTTEIRTVTFEELKQDLDRYQSWWRAGIVVVVVDQNQEQVAVFGPRLPGEERIFPPRWFFDELVPAPPMDPNDPERGSRALEEVRGYRPFT